MCLLLGVLDNFVRSRHFTGLVSVAGHKGQREIIRERHTESGEVIPCRHVHHGTAVPGRAAAAQPVQLVDEQRRVAADDGLLRAQGLVAEGRVLKAAHAAVAGVVGVEDVDDARDGLVPPLRVLLEVPRALLVGEPVDGRPGAAVRVCYAWCVSNSEVVVSYT